MIFTLIFSLILIFQLNSLQALTPKAIPSSEVQNVTAPAAEGDLDAGEGKETAAKQKEGDAPRFSLPRANSRGPRKIESSRSLGIETSARAALVFDEETGAVLFEKNSRGNLSLASLTKLMTALVFLDTNLNWDKKIRLAKEDEKEGGIFYARAPEEVTVRDLFNMMLVGSVNNAAMALVRSTGLSQAEFVEKMNQKAKILKLQNMVFKDPTGLESENMGNALDVAKLVSYALENEKIRETVTQKKYLFNPAQSKKTYYVKNTDELLWSFLNEAPYKISGGKTGYIEEAGYNLAVEIEKDGHRVIVVVLGSKTTEDRFQEAKGLAAWAFENYNW